MSHAFYYYLIMWPNGGVVRTSDRLFTLNFLNLYLSFYFDLLKVLLLLI